MGIFVLIITFAPAARKVRGFLLSNILNICPYVVHRTFHKRILGVLCLWFAVIFGINFPPQVTGLGKDFQFRSFQFRYFFVKCHCMACQEKRNSQKPKLRKINHIINRFFDIGERCWCTKCLVRRRNKEWNKDPFYKNLDIT